MHSSFVAVFIYVYPKQVGIYICPFFRYSTLNYTKGKESFILKTQWVKEECPNHQAIYHLQVYAFLDQENPKYSIHTHHILKYINT